MFVGIELIKFKLRLAYTCIGVISNLWGFKLLCPGIMGWEDTYAKLPCFARATVASRFTSVGRSAIRRGKRRNRRRRRRRDYYVLPKKRASEKNEVAKPDFAREEITKQLQFYVPLSDSEYPQ